jgi:hypothetical protein
MAALCALHNFIREHKSDDNDQTLNQDGMAGIESDDDTAPEQAAGLDTTDKDNIMAMRRDAISQSMWDDYQQRILGRHRDADNVGIDNDSDDDDIPYMYLPSTSLFFTIILYANIFVTPFFFISMQKYHKNNIKFHCTIVWQYMIDKEYMTRKNVQHHHPRLNATNPSLFRCH